MSTSITLVYMVHKVNVFSTRLIVNDLLLGIVLGKSSTGTGGEVACKSYPCVHSASTIPSWPVMVRGPAYNSLKFQT